MSGSGGLGLDDPARERALMAEIVAAVTSRLELDDLLQDVARIITNATATDVCFVHLVDHERQVLVLSGATPPFDRLAGHIELPIGEGVAGWVAAHGEAAVIEDKFSDPRYRYLPELHGEDFASLASVPMHTTSRTLVGVLNVHTRERREFTNADLAPLQTIANLMAGAVDNARLHARLAEREQAREQFAERLVAAGEQERRRLAGEIHDGISQRIVALSYHLTAAVHAVGSDDEFATRQIAAARQLAAAALEETRTAIAGLRPSVLDDLGLMAGLEGLARSLSGLNVDVKIEECVLPEHVETAIYRIAQEAVQNVVKHAGANHVSIELTASDGPDLVRLVVADDGGGFSRRDPLPVATEPITYGMSGMRERAELIDARLDVDTRPGGGTRVTVIVPR